MGKFCCPLTLPTARYARHSSTDNNEGERRFVIRRAIIQENVVNKNPNLLWFSALLLGWLFDFLFWGQQIGVNFAIFTDDRFKGRIDAGIPVT